jgi:hypothetical protein
MSDCYRVPTISTRQDGIGIPLFFWRNDLFLRTSSSLFAYISCTSLWYWAKAPSSLYWSMAECLLALASSFSDVSARSTVSPYPLCHMDLPGPTTSMGTRIDYSVGPWDYATCITRYLMP